MNLLAAPTLVHSSKTQAMKRVSVVVANFNMARYLADAIHSILAQTHPIHEVHVVDDGSTDGSRAVMETFRALPQVHLHYQVNGGQAKAKNRGVRESTGEFVAFCDADDCWARTKLEIQLPCFDLDPKIGVVHTNFVLINADGKPLGTPERQYFDGWVSGRLLIDNFVNGMASVVKRECFERVGLFDESLPMGIDYDLWLRISPHYKFHFVDDRSYFYRQWEGQMSRRHERRFECASIIMRRFIEANPGLIDDATIRDAWAHTYVSRGRTLLEIERNRREAVRCFLGALRVRPSYIPAWKSLLRAALPVQKPL